MSADNKIKVILYWHMHQPEYRDLRTGEYHQPWVYLHTIKDYVDMVAHIEANPDAKAVVNFAPILLDQISDYARMVSAYLRDYKPIRDPLLASLVETVLPETEEQKLVIIKACLRANEDRLIKRFPEYERLAEIAKYSIQHHNALYYLSDQFLFDLLVWYHIAWLGETIRKGDLRIKRLMEKQQGFTHQDRVDLLTVIGEQLSNVLQRYRLLAQRGQIELSLTPYAHPIMPLLIDIKSTQEAMPDAPLPSMLSYPGGEARVRWHIEKGLEKFNDYFGVKPLGCWPSEGSVSEATLKILDEYGFRWVASGEAVLRNSLAKSNINTPDEGDHIVHRPYKLKKTNLACFFRDDGLSDLIGFDYATWHADDAVANLVHHLENIANSCENKHECVVPIILDGENAWEYYPENGSYFLSALYDTLATHPELELTTFTESLSHGVTPKPLPSLVAGSWVYGTFSTWIGEPDKNRGWEMLCEAKHAYDAAISDNTLPADKREKLDMQLAICEGSDWFWWFGDYNPAESVSDFEYLFRLNLNNLYLLLGKEPPHYLSESFTHGSGSPAMGGVMRPGQEHM